MIIKLNMIIDDVIQYFSDSEEYDGIFEVRELDKAEIQSLITKEISQLLKQINKLTDYYNIL